MKTLTIPEFSLVVLIGASGSGKSTFARKHFRSTEIVSSDTCRGFVSDDENDQTISAEAFELVHTMIRLRLKLGRPTVVDATNIRPEDRKSLVQIAREYHVLPVAIVFKIPDKVCQARNEQREDRNFGSHVVRKHNQALRRGLRGLKREGFRYIYHLNSEEEVGKITRIERQPLWNNRKNESGPFDIIGDVHGCYDELIELVGSLGYHIEESEIAVHPESRRLGFVGDLVDRGPKSPDVLRFVMTNVREGNAFCVPGNHDAKLLRFLNGKNVQLTHGLDQTVSQLEGETEEFRDEVCAFLDGLVSHYVFDDGQLVVAHAGLKETMQGRGSGKVREFCLYGDTTGETDELGLPERLDWAADYRGRALVVYGHTPVPQPRWLNNTVNIDTGCVFGGELTALRYPEKETVSVEAQATYAEAVRPLHSEEENTAQQINDRVIDIADVAGKTVIETRYLSAITIREENATAALEVMSRFAVDPRWLIYLPPTMSPCETSKREGWLERPEEAFQYYRQKEVTEVVIEEKHMGSRAVVIVLRDPEVARTRFGFSTAKRGICYTRTGRPFFNDADLEITLLERLTDAIETSGLWDTLATDWICLDCELMPWSSKAQSLLQQQYAPVADASERHIDSAVALLSKAAARGVELGSLQQRQEERKNHLDRYRAAYQHYCWDVLKVEDLKLAPFHILASEGDVHTDKSHDWHMAQAEQIAKGDPSLFQATHWRKVNLASEEEIISAIQWWESFTAEGGEGMVVKPLHFIARDRRSLVQPAVKCRGREYLRIIYGPEYLLPGNLERLRKRGLGHKRSMALREFSLGLEALDRFVAREPLRRVHQCSFGVLAMESEAVDPRL